MSYLISVENVVALRLGYRDDLGNRAFNMLHYRLDQVTPVTTGTFTYGQASTVLPALIIAARLIFPSQWANAASVQVSMVDMMAQSIHPGPKSRAYNTTFSDPVPGLVAGDMLPLQDAPTLLKRTNFGGRSGLGRLFFVGVPESKQVAGLLVPDFFEDVSGFADALKGSITHVAEGFTYTWNPVLYSESAGPPPVVNVTPITDVALSDEVIKTQRRRRPGKGI